MNEPQKLYWSKLQPAGWKDSAFDVLSMEIHLERERVRRATGVDRTNEGFAYVPPHNMPPPSEQTEMTGNE